MTEKFDYERYEREGRTYSKEFYSQKSLEFKWRLLKKYAGLE